MEPPAQSVPASKRAQDDPRQTGECLSLLKESKFRPHTKAVFSGEAPRGPELLTPFSLFFCWMALPGRALIAAF